MTADRSFSYPPIAIAEQFTLYGSVTEINPLGNGNINDTFLVTVEGAASQHFVLQRLNTHVFCQPDWVMANIQRMGRHVGDRLQRESLDRRWEVPKISLTRTGATYYQAEDGSFWRALSYLDNSRTYDILESSDQAQEVGYALGMFHSLIGDLPPGELKDTLVGFHIAPSYFSQYKQILATIALPNSLEVEFCRRFVSQRTDLIPVLENAKQQGKLPLRPIHGDPKINNVLFDRDSDRAIGMIDLDTVKPGLIHYDIGDCLRSGCNLLGEETDDWQAVSFDSDLCRHILQGYLAVTKGFLTDSDRDYLFEAMRLLPFELGLRFFSDYLAGNVYFKTQDPDHNLRRALVQFQLTTSIEQQEPTLRRILQDLS
jgi:Ser/Thr protein kinase RdoA (MazF antagonist)